MEGPNQSGAQTMSAKQNQNGAAPESIASLNADGSLKWFIPPYVIPFVIVALVAAHAIWRT